MESYWDQTEGTGQLKGGILGFAKSGKSYTAAMLAIATREVLGLDGPVSMFDTEGGSIYVKHVIETATGKPFLVKKARSFDDLMAWGKACEEASVSVAIVDSITHPWVELCDSYLQQKNEALKAAGRNPVKRLDFSDWNVIKPTWAFWTKFYLNSQLSIIVCGRAGWEWNFEENDEGKKELRKTGVRMKVENEFGFEPSLLIEMQREQDISGPAPRMFRQATVLGDRFSILDGKSFEFNSSPDHMENLAAVRAAFLPHLLMLKPGTHNTINTAGRTGFGMDETGDAEWQREKRERAILAEEVQGALVSAMPGQDAASKKRKADLLQECFATRSWTAIENMSSERLRNGLLTLRQQLGTLPVGLNPVKLDEAVAVTDGN